MKNIRLLLLPFSFLYGTLVSIRNILYDIGIFRSKKFNIPVISVGNLCTGGSGKTPQIEYLIRLLSPVCQLATLSRGYGRSTSGFLMVSEQSPSTEVGDEPRQFKHKFPSVPVAVDGDRVHGIKKLCRDISSLGIVLLDDAFQHRAVKPGLSILLTDFSDRYDKDMVLPAGNLREFRSGAKRADVIIVTKCPETLSPIEKRCITRDLKPQAYQHVYFSKIIYGRLISLTIQNKQPDQNEIKLQATTRVLLLTGIANAEPLFQYISAKTKNIRHIRFSDHHEYSMVELLNLKQQFDQLNGSDKIIITTEKDAMRIDKSGLLEVVQDLPLFYLPIEASFLFDESESFNKFIRDYVKGFRRGTESIGRF